MFKIAIKCTPFTLKAHFGWKYSKSPRNLTYSQITKVGTKMMSHTLVLPYCGLEFPW